MVDDNIRLRAFATLQFYNPMMVLPALRQLELHPGMATLPPRVRQLRTPRMRIFREGRIGAIFAYGMSQCVLRCPVSIALQEAEDYDFVTRWRQGDTARYCPVQEKELPPVDLNPNATLDETLAILAESCPPDAPSDTVALVHLNRRADFQLARIKVPPMGFSQLWFVGAITLDQSRWMIFGDALKTPGEFEFDYPM